MRVLILFAALAVAACGPHKEAAKEPSKAAASQSHSTALAGPNDPAAKLAAASIPLEAESYDKEISVDQVARVEAGGKIFSTVGGDPAINGSYTFLALPVDAADGPEVSWKVFKIGDFNSWELVKQNKTRVVLKISHSVYDDASGEVHTAEQKIAVALPAPNAKSVSVTPLD